MYFNRILNYNMFPQEACLAQLKREIKVFKIKIHPLPRKEFLEIIESSLKEGKQIVQNGINAASVNELINNEELARAYNNSDLLNIDGMSMVWALRYLGYPAPERVACPDLANDILEMAERENYSTFFLGANKSSLFSAIKNLKINFPHLNIAGFHNGYFTKEEEDTIVKMINRANADILFLGLPSPQKELFIEKYKGELKIKYSFGVGGYFDILSGKTKRAPIWMQNRGMEWFFRLMQEPKRLWYRYMVGNIKFITLVLKEKRRINYKK
jgi:N-acetylglucosaminyldiphosphoundecaprenol N-acetyl-beta-D-mannosaminyltransferase